MKKQHIFFLMLLILLMTVLPTYFSRNTPALNETDAFTCSPTEIAQKVYNYDASLEIQQILLEEQENHYFYLVTCQTPQAQRLLLTMDLHTGDLLAIVPISEP